MVQRILPRNDHGAEDPGDFSQKIILKKIPKFQFPIDMSMPWILTDYILTTGTIFKINLTQDKI